MPTPTVIDICFAQLNQLLNQSQRLVVGLSGGLDSVVLLKALSAYCHQPDKIHRYTLEAVHVNHQLSSNADIWQSHCEELCREYDIPFTSKAVVVGAEGKGLEAAAREARYRVFQDVCGEDGVLLLAHHQDDQVETLFLRLMRGSGPLGLSAMRVRGLFGSMPVLRPLLSVSREALERYAHAEGLSWVHDESNDDSGYDRNYLRNDVLPLLKERWPAMLSSVSRSARLCHETVCLADELAQEDADQLQDEVGALDVNGLLLLSTMRVRNLLRFCLRERGLPLPSEVVLERILSELIPARHDAQPLVQWSGAQACRYDGKLYLLAPINNNTQRNVIYSERRKAALSQLERLTPVDSEVQGYRLPWGGELFIAVSCDALRALRSIDGQLLHNIQPLSLAAEQWDVLGVGLGRSKDRIQPTNRSANPLKHWWQQSRVPPWFRDKQPLIYCNDELLLAPGLIACGGSNDVASQLRADIETRWIAWWPYRKDHN